jgi:hypothetical protein
MRVRLAAFLALVVLLAGIPHLSYERPTVQSSSRESRAASMLMPTFLGRFQTVNRWSNPLPGGTIEQGALYSDGAANDPVQLDMFVNSLGPHNGIACYLSQGFTFSSQQLKVLRSSNSQALFQVAVLRDDETVRAVASTECWSWGCKETPVTRSNSWSVIWRPIPPPSAEIPVPVSITVDEPASFAGSEHAGQRLIERIDTFIAQLDLTRIQRFAAEHGKIPAD